LLVGYGPRKGSLVVASTKSSAVLVRAFESIVRRRAQESMVLLADVKTSRVLLCWGWYGLYDGKTWMELTLGLAVGSATLGNRRQLVENHSAKDMFARRTPVWYSKTSSPEDLLFGSVAWRCGSSLWGGQRASLKFPPPEQCSKGICRGENGKRV